MGTVEYMSSKKRLLTVAVLATTLLVTGCKDEETKAEATGKTTETTQTTSSAATPTEASSPEEAVSIYVGGMNKIADALETVSDEASAQKAAGVIDAISSNLGKLSKNSEEKFSSAMTGVAFASNPDIMKTQQRISAAMLKIAQTDPQLMTKLSKAMSQIGK